MNVVFVLQYYRNENQSDYSDKLDILTYTHRTESKSVEYFKSSLDMIYFANKTTMEYML